MAKKDWKKEADAIKKIVVAAKKKPQNFALVELKEGMCLCAHPTHALSKLTIEAKNADGAKKANCVTGKLKLNGKEFVFDCLEDKLPGGMEIKFKQYLKKAEHGAFKGVFNLPEAEKKEAKQAEEEQAAPPPKPKPAEPEPAAEAQPASGPAEPASESGAQTEAAAEPETEGATEAEAAGGEQAPSKAQLTGFLAHIKEIFELSYEGMDETQVKELKAALKTIGAAIASGDLTGAQNMMNKIGLLTGVTPSSPKEPITLAAPKKKGDDLDPAELKKKKKELTKSLADLKPDLQKATVGSDPAGQQDLQKLIKQFQKQFKANQVGDAEESFDELKTKVETFLEQQEEAAAQAEEAAPSEAPAAEGGNGAAPTEASGEDTPPGLSPERKKARADELAGLQKELDDLLATL